MTLHLSILGFFREFLQTLTVQIFAMFGSMLRPMSRFSRYFYRLLEKKSRAPITIGVALTLSTVIAIISLSQRPGQ